MGKYHFFEKFLLLILSIFISGESYPSTNADQNSKPMIVIIDPGHGGKDPGAINKGIREKDVVLGVGLKLGKYISETFPDVKVIFTRSTDVFVPLIDRSRIANKNKANLFISIHANTCGTPSVRGTETYFLGEARTNDNLDVAKKENSVILLEDNYETTYEGFDPNSSESYIMFTTIQNAYLRQSLSFANDIQRQFESRTEGENRGPKQAGFLVLRESSMPSVLVETGFISNPAEAKYLKSDDGQRNIALSILDAFKKFKSRNSFGNATASVDKEPIHKDQSADSSSRSKTKSEIDSDKTKTDTNKAANVSVKTEIKSEEKIAGKPKPLTLAKKENSKITSNVSESKTKGTESVENDIYYSVQIGANTKPVEPAPYNFKGLKNVRREKEDKYYRYYIGKDASLEKAEHVLQEIRSKFSQAFIVSFNKGKRTIINTETK